MAALLAYIRAEPDLDLPLIPLSWSYTLEPDRWATIYPLGRDQPNVFFHARLVMRHPSFPQRAIFICTGPRVVLDRLAERIASDGLAFTRTWLTLQALRDDVTTIAQQIRAAWPDEREHDTSGIPIGPLVAHHRRMASFLSESAETE